MSVATPDAPSRFLVGAEEARWQATEVLFERAAVTDLVGSGCWRELEIDACTSREVEAALEEVLSGLGAQWPDVIAVAPGGA